MDHILIQGGHRLAGEVNVSGAKNASLPIMSAALLAPGCTQLHNVPELMDVRILTQLLESLGTKVTRRLDGAIALDVVDESVVTADYDLVRQMRASICVLGPLLARRKQAIVSLPGGCNIGNRPIDLHLKGLAALGAEIHVKAGYVHASAQQLRGAHIYLAGTSGSTVTGTCNVMSAATLARGTTIIDAAACEPEVVALADFLNQMGARISGHGTTQLVIEGVEELHPTSFQIIPDRIEAATLLLAAAITRGSVTLKNTIPGHIHCVIDTLRQMGFEIRLHSPSTPNAVQRVSLTSSHCPTAVDITALPYPGFPTDLQAVFMSLVSTIPETTVIRDLVFPDRFTHVAELCRMGADIRLQGDSVIISKSPPLSGAHVLASDLRAAAALVVAGLAAEGETTINQIHHLDRGYEQLERKLAQLGAKIQRLSESNETPSQTSKSLQARDPRHKKSA
ncbi:UDP-N-acetylglucosamine 1-carboxyvinyltransferase [Planctomicrobium sp. SH668]|uniref:UDP-N-acetylglucosamine 1-carboxyvinyltransferase n=1 Tax=Planctomicrobium sp. SH668 TaxID=3448126 RepID=UPI003F5B90C6